jgi:hypothetical protein
MARIRNISPLGDQEIPALGLAVPAGEVAEVTDEQAELLVDGERFELADVPASKRVPRATSDPTSKE